MAKKKTVTYLVGIAYCGDSIVLLPGPGTFDLPRFEKKGSKKKCLLRGLAEAGFEDASIVTALDPIVEEADGLRKRYLAFVFAYGNMAQSFRKLPLDTDAKEAPELAAKYLWKCDVYAPIYQGKERTVPLLPPEAKKVKHEIDCLTYHRRIIGRKVLREFLALTDSASSMRRINEAFVTICNTYHVNPNRTLANPCVKGKH